MKNITMKEVAESLNVSKATVSRALNNKSDVSEEMRAKILKRCEEIGYKINHNAQALSTSRNNTIGILAGDAICEKGEFFYKEIFTNVVTILEEKGYTTILKIVHPTDVDTNNIPLFMEKKMVDGIIILGELPISYINEVSKYNIPIVLVDFDTGELKYDSVVTNNISSISTITKKLISDGYKRIAFVGNDALTSSILERYQGYYIEMHNAGLVTTKIIDKKSQHDEPNYKIDDIKDIDIFICNNDYAAYRLVEFIKENGYLVPEDKKVIGFDNTFYSEISKPKIPTMDVNRELFASEAIRLLFLRMNKKDTDVVNLSIKAGYIEK